MLKWNRSVLYDRVEYSYGDNYAYIQRFAISAVCGKSVMLIAGSVRQGIDSIAFYPLFEPVSKRRLSIF